MGTLRWPFPSPTQLNSPPLCLLDLTKMISCPAEILSIIPPLGVCFASDRNMAFTPLFHPSLFSSFLRNLPALKAADRPERCWPEGLTVCKPPPPPLSPYFAVKMWCFLRFKEGSLLHLGKVKSLKSVESQSAGAGDSYVLLFFLDRLLFCPIGIIVVVYLYYLHSSKCQTRHSIIWHDVVACDYEVDVSDFLVLLMVPLDGKVYGICAFAKVHVQYIWLYSCPLQNSTSKKGS